MKRQVWRSLAGTRNRPSLSLQDRLLARLSYNHEFSPSTRKTRECRILRLAGRCTRGARPTALYTLSWGFDSKCLLRASVAQKFRRAPPGPLSTDPFMNAHPRHQDPGSPPSDGPATCTAAAHVRSPSSSPAAHGTGSRRGVEVDRNFCYLVGVVGALIFVHYGDVDLLQSVLVAPLAAR